MDTASVATARATAAWRGKRVIWNSWGLIGIGETGPTTGGRWPWATRLPRGGGAGSAGHCARPARSRDDRQQFDVETQGRVGADGTVRGAAGAIGQLAGNPEPVLGADRHQRDAFGPAGDHLVERELGGGATLV